MTFSSTFENGHERTFLIFRDMQFKGYEKI